MKITDLQGKKIGIFGFGVEGRSLFEYLEKHNCKKIIIFDEKDIDQLEKKIEKRIGKLEKLKTNDIEIAFRSPGIKRNRLEDILSKNTKITSATNLFFSNKKGKIIGITGTKGKSTTVQLVSYMLQKANLKVFAGGNIGSPLVEFLDDATDDSYSVVELSSFQLQDLKYGPDIAIILPIFADHLDYHDDLDEYFLAKSMIVRNMGVNDVVFCARQQGAQKTIESSKPKIFLFGEGDNPLVASVAKKYKIPEINLLSAVSLGRFLNIKVNCEDIAKNFTRLPFRIQFSKRGKGLSFYNDSAATNPISTIKAMATMDVPYLLIAGGSSKNLSFKNLAKAIKEDGNLKEVYLIGKTAAEITDELKKIGFKKPLLNLENLARVFEKIKGEPPDVKAILFSPACASFDQFLNYKERGKYFDQKVKQLLSK